MKIFKKLPVLDINEYYLREVSYNDINDIYEYCSDEEVVKWLGFNKHESTQDTMWSYENVFFKRNENNLNNPHVIVDKSNNKVIGMCDFNAFIEDTPQIGYVLNQNYWGKGIITKACKALINFGFELCNVEEIVISHHIGNDGSQKVIEKCGFKYTYNKTEKLKGNMLEMRCYKINKEDFYEKS